MKYVLEECTSTNMEAHDAKYSHGDAIIAISQTEGRGQKGTKWDSRAGENLTFSLVLEPVFLPAARQFLLSQVASLAVADTLAAYGIDVRVKWPNDIYAGDRKICGMLLENDLHDDHVARTIAGIGINVNQIDFPDWVPNPTSMALATGNTFDTGDVFDTFYDLFGQRYSQLEESFGARVDSENVMTDIGIKQVESDYRSLLYRLDEPHRFTIPGLGEIEGTIRSVEPSGRLIAEVDGELRGFLFKEIEFII